MAALSGLSFSGREMRRRERESVPHNTSNLGLDQSSLGRFLLAWPDHPDRSGLHK